MARTAYCSCGALRLDVSGEPDAVVACHCGECQRRTGSVFDVGAYYKKEHVHVIGFAESKPLRARKRCPGVRLVGPSRREPTGLAHVSSPAAKRRPDRRSSRSSARRKGRWLCIT